MKNVMIDLETFGIGTNACIVQVGACFFDTITGELGKEFKENIDARTAILNGAVADADTIYWWLAQSAEARASICKPGLEERVVLEKLNEFLKDAKFVWCHATFDFPIIMNAFKRLGIKPTITFRAARDLRTLGELSGEWFSKPRTGTHHDALDDCKFQVQYCVAALVRLRSKK